MNRFDIQYQSKVWTHLYLYNQVCGKRNENERKRENVGYHLVLWAFCGASSGAQKHLTTIRIGMTLKDRQNEKEWTKRWSSWLKN